MKETTKYNNYRFIGKINIDEIMPWFEFDKGKPWDQAEVPWSLENKVRREILIKLANYGPMTFEEIHNKINFSPKPILISKDEYKTNVSYQWSKTVIENHLLNLEWYNLIRKKDNKYEITFPVLTMEKLEKMDPYIEKFAQHWIKIIQETKSEVSENLITEKISGAINQQYTYQILLEKATEKLYALMKKEGLLPDIPNIKSLWAEQLRKIKFEEWVKRTF
ncbi:MAG: hypothetical protein GF383_09550 [Candidatus Lokiarchaeota archaeon]|nr:hypothetical protein [Candidatus Lokiarchaeota archaeon]MBD3340758.1 hypothetical protein [Candidatus Lokiarchaeota archaeon]